MLNKFKLDAKFIHDLQLLIIEKDSVTIAKKLKEVHPADIADIIEQLSEKNAQFLFEIFENPKSADIIIELEDDVRESILSAFTPKKIAKILIDNLESDDAIIVIKARPFFFKIRDISLIDKIMFSNVL